MCRIANHKITTTGHFFNRINLLKNPAKNNPTQWEIVQPSDGFSENPVGIKIPLGLLQRATLKPGIRNPESGIRNPESGITVQ